MGMDLSPAYDVGPYHANWTGWSTLGDLLYECGADLSMMAGTNDGMFVPEVTACAWADALETHLPRMVVSAYPDSSYVGGMREEIHVEGTGTPVLLSTAQVARSVMLPDMFDDTGDLDDVPTVKPLAQFPEMTAWIMEFVTFLRTSGGFEQW